MEIVRKDIEVRTFKEWKEFDESVFEKILESHGDQQTSDEWYEHTYDYFEELAEKEGLTIKDMNFSGFWSQGDGASFTGTIDVPKWLRGQKKLSKYSKAMYHFKKGNLEKEVAVKRNSSNYVHEMTCYVEDIEWDRDYNSTILSGKTTALIRELDEELESYRVEKCYELYKRLEEEYEYLRSEESIMDWIGNDGTLFDENGDEYDRSQILSEVA